jgi:hypothetical protein
MKLNKDKPFADKAFFKDVNKAVLSLEFKLYGKIPAKLLSNDLVEIDYNMGSVHLTEKDFKALSKIMDKANKKHGTSITYCIYHSDQFPGKMLLNIRGPKAPKLLSANITF